jgi:hypothetical protein
MARALIIVVAILVAFLVYAVIDVILIDKSRIRGLPRALWVIVCFIPALGGILWFFVGRGAANKNGGGRSTFFGPRRSGPSAPDDDVDFLRGLNDPRPPESHPENPRPGDDGPGTRA